MIKEVMIANSSVTGKLRVVVYPKRGVMDPRVHVEPTKSSRRRLEKMMHEHDTRTYLQDGRIVVWIAR